MKKKRYSLIIRIVLFALVTVVSFIYTVKWLDEVNMKIDDDNVDKIIKNSNSMSDTNIVSELVNYVIGLDLFNPIDMLNSNYIGLAPYTVETKVFAVGGYLVDKTANKLVNPDIKPLVYIYNTHQGEKYDKDGENTATVITASNILKDKLASYNIQSMVENTNVQAILNMNGWNYASSYKVTGMLLEQAKKDYPSFQYFVDIHRDSVSKSISTVTIGDKNYAKVMFLVGLENPNYKDNLAVMTKFNEMMEKEYPGISRGIYKKSGPLVNGVYNQNLSKNCILIEVGGEYNSLEEVTNTIEAFAKVFNAYLGGNYG